MKIIVENITSFVKGYDSQILLGLGVLFLAHILAKAVKKAKSNAPPGPMGLPVLGYFPFLTKNPHLDLMQLGKKYGDVFSLKLGQQDFLILNGAEAIREAFNKREFLGRPPSGALQKVLPLSAFFDNDILIWKEQRKPVFQFMKEVGLGKTKIEENLMEEINHFMDFLRNSEAQPIDIRKPVWSSIMNNIFFIIIGKRFEYKDPKFQFLGREMEEFFKNFNQNSLDGLLPWIRYVPFASKFLLFYKSKFAVESYERFFLKEISENFKTLDPAHIRSFVDRYSVEINKQSEKNPNTSFSQSMLIKHCVDLCFTASETVEASLLWSVYIFAAFPEVQKKVQKEIMEVIGQEKMPEYMDLRNMPYTHAVMLEIMRWKCVVPITLIRYTTDSTTVGGYNIPKDISVIANLWAVMHDPRNWEEPNKFKPERFLNKDGMSAEKSSFFMPFSVGKRACPGESLAHLELFLYCTCILREFDVSFPDKMEPTFNGNLLTVYRPEPYLVRFVRKK